VIKKFPKILKKRKRSSFSLKEESQDLPPEKKQKVHAEVGEIQSEPTDHTSLDPTSPKQQHGGSSDRQPVTGSSPHGTCTVQSSLKPIASSSSSHELDFKSPLDMDSNTFSISVGKLTTHSGFFKAMLTSGMCLLLPPPPVSLAFGLTISV
jgi:hypothetical protein